MSRGHFKFFRASGVCCLLPSPIEKWDKTKDTTNGDFLFDNVQHDGGGEFGAW